MDFIVSQECVELGLRAGAVVFRDVRITDAGPALRSEISHAAEAIRGEHRDPANIRLIPKVAAFHAILREVGANPRREPPSVDRLLALAIKRGHLPAINNLVDAYNLVSIGTLCSIGAHDLDLISLPVELRLLTGQESFTPLGRPEPEPVRPGEFGYVDAQGRVLCRLDVRQAEFSKVSAETANVFLIIEANSTHAPDAIRQAFEECIDRVLRHCGGRAEVISRPPESASGGRSS